MDVAVLLLAGYLLGSFPSGYLVARTRGVDIRYVGDRNVGMMNVYREVGPAWGFLTLFLDVAKAAAAVGLAGLVDVGEGATMATGFTALVGHRYPVTLGFHGGRSAASAGGVVLGFTPAEAIGPVALGVVVVAVSRSAVVGLASGFATLLFVLLIRQVGAGPVLYAIAVPVYAGLNDLLDRSRARRRPAAVAHSDP